MERDGSLPQVFRAGLDVGSTTAKLVVLDPAGRLRFSDYRRHASDIFGTLSGMFAEAEKATGDGPVRLVATGSAGMGVAETAALSFVQEVNAAVAVVRSFFPAVSTLIDIGGEDSKMVFLSPGRPPDIRMNGRCAGGTGAFIDQMAGLLGLSLKRMDELAGASRRVYPIASRCGVFAKTDVQNLLSRKIDPEDVCASIFHAVALQNLTTLARGVAVRPKVLLCGGPLSFLASLRDILRRILGLPDTDVVLPGNSLYLPAWGAALSNDADAAADTMAGWHRRLCRKNDERAARFCSRRLPALFADENDFREWTARRAVADIPEVSPRNAAMPLYLGIDSGSTTTKLLALDEDERVAFRSYRPNLGNPIGAASEALKDLRSAFADPPAIGEAAVTGYGESLIRAVFDLDIGVVETVAHWRGAARFDRNVSFILDIGGQDMKAIFIADGGIRRIEINEACSSGCGTFIEGFARALGLGAEEFAEMACRSRAPCDLGTRCTVFMNSRIKEAQRENASIADISAGLAYSVVKNALYKVLKLRNPKEMGDHIVVQGGTFRNPAVVRALELSIGRSVASSRWPEMMGAYGAALLAKEGCRHYGRDKSDQHREALCV